MSLDHVAIIRAESELLAEFLVQGPLDSPVAGCPGWNLGDLGAHLVEVQRWSTHVLQTGGHEGFTHVAPLPEQTASALRDSCRNLLETIAAANPVAPCWNFSSGPQQKQFWFRRQALEVAVHRWDGEAAIVDEPTPIATDVAAHVVDEFVHLNAYRVIDREGIDLSSITGDMHLHCTDLDGIDAPGEWTLEVIDGALAVSDAHRKCAVAVRGTASDLALFIYGRLAREELDVFGDAAVLDQWASVFAF